MTLPRLHQDPQDLIDEQASNWVVRQESTALSPDEQRDLQAWRAADPRHDRTYDSLRRTWGDIKALSGLAELAPVMEPHAAAGTGERANRRWRPFAAAGFASAAAAVLVAILGVDAPSPPPAPVFATEVAELRRLRLGDGTLITLGAKSEISVQFAGGERRVTLAGGEAFFEVARDVARPFVVTAGGSTIRVLGTKFDVARAAGSVRVSVLEGHVQVKAPSAGSQTLHNLRAGQHLELASSSGAVARESVGATPVAISQAPVPTPGSWRSGRLTYENARLGHVVADINRYYEPGVELDPAIADLRVTASFKTRELEAFLAALDTALPVRVTEEKSGAIQLSQQPE
jgi:transmembrane sensor